MRKIKAPAVPDDKKFKVTIDPLEVQNSIVIPTIEYEITPKIVGKTMFNGLVIPMPKVLLYYLANSELLVAATILEETAKMGVCKLTVQEIAIRLHSTPASISGVLGKLRRFQLLVEKNNGRRGNGSNRMLNFDTIQHLNDLADGEDPGVYVRIRRASRKVSIANMTKEDIARTYDTKILAPDHDPAEEEEYD